MAYGQHPLPGTIFRGFTRSNIKMSKKLSTITSGGLGGRPLGHGRRFGKSATTAWIKEENVWLPICQRTLALYLFHKNSMADSATTVPFFKKSKRPTGNTRKRSPTLDQADAEPAPSAVVRPAHRNQPKLLSQGTKRTVSQRVASEYDGADVDQDSRDGSAVGVNWTGSGATKDHAEARDILYGEEVEEMMEQKRKKARLDRGEVDDVDAPDGLYRGQASYQHSLGRKDETALPKAQRIGPVKATSTIRTVTMIDYQPDVCKDYKETGYCGFGDTCKFLHDRGTYLQGWQLDKISNKSNFITFATRAGLEKKREDTDEDDSDDEDIPFACIICRQPYTDPIVTKCGHYFCQACAIKRYAKNPKCAACGAPTNGIFNKADKIIAKSKANRMKEAKQLGVDDEQSGDEGRALEGVEIGDDD